MSDDLVAASRCPWCSATAPIGATACPACGAALAQRESIGDLVIPGLTAVDPALQAIDGQPMRLRGPSPTQGMANGIMGAALIGGPIGLAVIGGVAASAAVEYLATGRDRSSGSDRLEDVGRPSPTTLLALERIDRAESGDAAVVGAAANDPWRDEPRREAAPADGAANDPWRDEPRR